MLVSRKCFVAEKRAFTYVNLNYLNGGFGVILTKCFWSRCFVS